MLFIELVCALKSLLLLALTGAVAFILVIVVRVMAVKAKIQGHLELGHFVCFVWVTKCIQFLFFLGQERYATGLTSRASRRLSGSTN